MFTRIMYQKLSVADQDKSLEFYSKLGFKKKIDFPGPEGRFLTMGFEGQNADLMLLPIKDGFTSNNEGIAIDDPGVLFIESNDLRSDFVTLKSQDVQFVEEAPIDYPWGIRITALDPDGNPIALRQQNHS